MCSINRYLSCSLSHYYHLAKLYVYVLQDNMSGNSGIALCGETEFKIKRAYH